MSNTSQTQQQCIPSAQQMHVNHMSKRRAKKFKRKQRKSKNRKCMLITCQNAASTNTPNEASAASRARRCRASRGNYSETSVKYDAHTWSLGVLNLLHMLEYSRTSSYKFARVFLRLVDVAHASICLHMLATACEWLNMLSSAC